MTRRETEAHPQTSDEAVLLHISQGDRIFPCKVQKGIVPLVLVMIKEEHFKQETREEVKRKGDMSLFQESEVDLGPHIRESDNYSLLLLHFVMCL